MKIIKIGFREDTWKFIKECLEVSLKGYSQKGNNKISKILHKIELENKKNKEVIK